MTLSADPPRSRSRAVARLRKDRLDRRATDLIVRQSMIIAVTERVVELVAETQDALAELTSDRTAWSKALRDDLAAHQLELSKEVMEKLASTHESRLEKAPNSKSERQAFVTELKADVVRIVTEDFH